MLFPLEEKLVAGYGELDVKNPDKELYQQWACLLHAIVNRGKKPSGSITVFSRFSDWTKELQYRRGHDRLVDLSPVLAIGDIVDLDCYISVPVTDAACLSFQRIKRKTIYPRWVRRANTVSETYSYTITKMGTVGTRVIHGKRESAIEAHVEALKIMRDNFRLVLSRTHKHHNRKIINRVIDKATESIDNKTVFL